MLETRIISGDGWRTAVLVDPEASDETAPMLTPTLGEYPIYDTPLYDVMVSDTERHWRFCEALERFAKDRTVLDIGTGARLVWALESLRSGARRVVAVEAMPESYRSAASYLASLDVRDRVTLLQGESTSLVVEPKADLCVAEIIGSLPGAEGAAAVLSDARRRHLKPGAVIVPDRCLTQAAMVNFSALFGGGSPAFSMEAIPWIKRIFDWNGGPFDVRLRLSNPAKEAILSDSAVIERLDFNGDLKVEQTVDARLTVERSGVVDGLLTWLSLRCLPEQEPLDALECDSNWASIYLPLFEKGIPVESGDVLEVNVQTTLSQDGVHPDYHVSAELHTARGVFRGGIASTYMGGGLHGHPIYRDLFPV